MPEQTARQAGAEAKAWFSKLSATSVSVEDIEAFAAWMRGPTNRAAYNRVEARARKVPEAGLFTEAEILAALKRRPDLARAYRARFKRAERPAELKDIARELAIQVGLPYARRQASVMTSSPAGDPVSRCSTGPLRSNQVAQSSGLSSTGWRLW